MLHHPLLRSGLTALLITTSSLLAAEDPRMEKLRKADDERVAAVLAADKARLSDSFSDELRYAHSTGAVDDKASYIDLLVSGRTKYNVFDYGERAFTFPAPGIALMTGKVHINATSATGVTDSVLSFLAVWREENGQWRFLAWQSCKLPPATGAADINDSMIPVKPNLAPGPEYADSTRIFQGIPGMERAANGRLWALWYAGGPAESGEGAGNYVMLVSSGDDGKTWSGPRMVIDPPGDVRAYDPTLWHDPQGRLWLFWAQSSHWWDGRSGVWAMVCENSGDESPRWSEPRRLCNGIMMNKPTVLSNGDWLLPVSMWAMTPDKRTRPEHQHKLPDESGAQVVISRDQGKTFSFLGKTRAPENIFDEHMVVQRRDGSLWMLIRTKLGIAESVSTDGGKTWTPGAPSKIPHVNSRFFIRRLASGKLLLVRHNPPDMKTRSHLTAFLSDDDGVTWSGGLLLDERKGVSYPDGVQDKDGVIRIIYDFARTAEKQILMAAFTEADVAQGKPSGTTRLQVVVNQATAQSPKKATEAAPKTPQKKE